MVSSSYALERFLAELSMLDIAVPCAVELLRMLLVQETENPAQMTT